MRARTRWIHVRALLLRNCADLCAHSVHIGWPAMAMAYIVTGGTYLETKQVLRCPHIRAY